MHYAVVVFLFPFFFNKSQKKDSEKKKEKKQPRKQHSPLSYLHFLSPSGPPASTDEWQKKVVPSILEFPLLGVLVFFQSQTTALDDV